MKLILDEKSLNAIFPFAFETNSKGELTFIGKSLKKHCRYLQLGDLYSKKFRVLRPTLGIFSDHPSEFVGEGVLLGIRSLERKKAKGLRTPLHLRGGVIHIRSPHPRYLFVLSPAVADLKEIPALNLNFSDFAVGDPIFDMLLLIQSERQALGKAILAQEQLQWENRISKLFHQIILESAELTEANAAIELTLRLICQELQWQIGHAYSPDPVDPEKLISSGVWYLSDPVRFKEFKEISDRSVFKKGEGLIGEAFKKGRMIWSLDPMKEPQLLRVIAFQTLPEVSMVIIPVSVHGKVHSVLELVSDRKQKFDLNLHRSFEILSRHLSAVIERQQTQAREREQLASLAASSRLVALGEMAAGVGHEINNPLTAVRLGVQWLAHHFRDEIGPTDQINKILTQIEAGSVRIAKIIAGLQAISREGSGDPLIETSLRKIMEDSLSLCEARFKQRGIHLQEFLCPEDSKLFCRPVQISQVILNLLNNAFDAVAGQKGAWVRIDCADHGKELEFSITDSGPGIPPALFEEIMRPFFTTKPAGKGTGLGLPVSSKIVADHGGRLFIDRNSKNTRFVVSLPKKTETESLRPAA